VDIGQAGHVTRLRCRRCDEQGTRAQPGHRNLGVGLEPHKTESVWRNRGCAREVGRAHPAVGAGPGVQAGPLLEGSAARVVVGRHVVRTMVCSPMKHRACSAGKGADRLPLQLDPHRFSPGSWQCDTMIFATS
jgi:hypothetical protein